MTMATLVLIASVGLAYVGLGVWAITLIFPRSGSRVGAAHPPPEGHQSDHS